MFSLQPKNDDFGNIEGPSNALKAKGAGILRPTASNNNQKGGAYKAKKSLGNVMRQRNVRDAKFKKYIED